MKKKLLSVLLASVLALSFSACSGKSSTPSSAPVEQGSSSSTAPAGTTWPNKPITLIVGYGAGGSSDLGVRMLQPYLEKLTGQTVTVVNQTGAQGWVAWTDLAKAAPDGYTISLVNIPGFYAGYLDSQQERKENMSSFTFICNHVSDWGVLIAKKGQFADMKAFMDMAKSEGVTVGDVGLGGNKHMQTEELAAKNDGSKITAVHMNGWADNYAAVLGGTLDAASATIGDILNQLSDGDMEVLCVFAPERSNLLPDVPTCEELGFGNVYGPSARGYMMPAGVDDATLAKISKVFEEAITDPAHIEDMKKLGLQVDYFGGDKYAAFLKENETKAAGMSDLFGW